MTISDAQYILKQIDDAPIPTYLISTKGRSILRGIIADACMVLCLQVEKERKPHAKASV